MRHKLFTNYSSRSKLPFRLGALSCPLLVPVLVRDSTTDVPLLAFTHDTSRSELRSSRSYRKTSHNIRSEVALPETEIEINPHDAAILIAMALEAARCSSAAPQKTTVFKVRAKPIGIPPFEQCLTDQQPVLITPTPNREALYVYRASIPLEYLESLKHIYNEFTSEIIITRTNLTFNDETVFLDCLGHVLEVHIWRAASVEVGYREMQKSRKRKRKLVEGDGNSQEMQEHQRSKKTQ